MMKRMQPLNFDTAMEAFEGDAEQKGNHLSVTLESVQEVEALKDDAEQKGGNFLIVTQHRKTGSDRKL